MRLAMIKLSQFESEWIGPKAYKGLSVHHCELSPGFEIVLVVLVNYTVTGRTVYI